MNEKEKKRINGTEELTTVTKTYDLVRELTARVAKFPRDFRFLLGDRILVNVYQLLDLLIEAKYTKQKAGLLHRSNLCLEQMRFQVRLSTVFQRQNTRREMN